MNKEERKIKAKTHYDYTQKHFKEETEKSIKNSVIYDNEDITVTNKNSKSPTIAIWDMTTEMAIKCVSSNCCVLNFASYTSPGGGYLNGAIAQEEALCNSSNLYDILISFKDKYERNYKDKTRLNYGLYSNWIIYSPDVCFIYNENKPNENVVKCNMITCAAPNYNRYIGNKTPTTEFYIRYEEALESRCKYILDVAEKNNNKVLILGAFGCGVFGNMPEDVAENFKKLLNSKRYTFDKVIFAIPKDRNNNLNYFKEVFSK